MVHCNLKYIKGNDVYLIMVTRGIIGLLKYENFSSVNGVLLFTFFFLSLSQLNRDQHPTSVPTFLDPPLYLFFVGNFLT